ncbi:hypothetical protein C1646_766153 [Rhizophagus diaphanus]|nr:hypothetical protein C1646_766153 [Rhizophagus diaphanus] [Rhizophagus sp. MUCL 43196]
MRVIDLPNNSSRWLPERCDVTYFCLMLEQTYINTCAGDKIEVYGFLEALGLLDNEVSPVIMDDDDNNESDINEEDSDDDQKNY